MDQVRPSVRREHPPSNVNNVSLMSKTQTRVRMARTLRKFDPLRPAEQRPVRQHEPVPVRHVVRQVSNRQVQTNCDQFTAAHIMMLQRTRGNREIGRLLAGGNLRVSNMQAASETPRVARQPDATPGARNRLEPPPKDSRPTPERSAALTEWLTAHVAGHALAVNTYTFYEVIDRYLGPWGSRGYPIAYGKRYNVLFSTNRTLMAHPVASAWVWKTTILLQKALVDFIVARYDAGTLGRLTEAELRAAAFDSHPLAYTEGGLALVTLVAPELVPEIAKIPSAEFNPASENFGASVEQVITTGGMVAPRMLGDLIAAAMPAHSRSLRVARETRPAGLSGRDSAQSLPDTHKAGNCGWGTEQHSHLEPGHPAVDRAGVSKSGSGPRGTRSHPTGRPAQS